MVGFTLKVKASQLQCTLCKAVVSEVGMLGGGAARVGTIGKVLRLLVAAVLSADVQWRRRLLCAMVGFVTEFIWALVTANASLGNLFAT